MGCVSRAFQTVSRGGDPRGCTVKLKVPSGRTDDFGGTDLCVPQ
jgi:hypothetical protein